MRHEAVKALISLYAKDDHIGGMQHFTDRFKGQLVRMATGEVDLSVRISCIHVLRQIDTHGLLEDAQRDEVATLVFEKERRVRQAVAGFFQGILDELVEERQIELDAGSGIKGSVVKDQLKLKCVAELLVKYGRALDGIEDGDGEDEDDEGEGEGVVEDVKSRRGRVAFAVEALWGQVEVLRDWQGIMDFLLLDHSDAQGDEAPKKGKGKKGKGKAKANGAGGDSEVEPACRLTEDEETLLVEVLVASLGKATGHSATSKKVRLRSPVPPLRGVDPWTGLTFFFDWDCRRRRRKKAYRRSVEPSSRPSLASSPSTRPCPRASSTSSPSLPSSPSISTSTCECFRSVNALFLPSGCDLTSCPLFAVVRDPLG